MELIMNGMCALMFLGTIASAKEISMPLLANGTKFSEDVLRKNVSCEEKSFFVDFTEETRKIIENVWFIGCILSACLVGVPANTINCVVFTRQGLQYRMNLCLFCLALSDLVYLLCTFTMFPISSLIRYYDDVIGEKYYIKCLTLLASVSYGSRSTSSFIGVVIAIERCLCVLIPLRAHTLIQTRTMGIMLIGSFFLFQLIFITYALSVQASWTPRKNWYYARTQFFMDNKILVKIVQTILLDVVAPFANFIVLIVVTIITILKLKVAMKWRQKSTIVLRDSINHQVSLTTMLVIMSAVHITTMVPFVAWQSFCLFFPDPLNTYYNIFLTFRAVTTSFPALNSSIHIFIYYYRSSRYRQIFRKIFCQI